MNKVLKVMCTALSAVCITGMFSVNADAYTMNSKKDMKLDFDYDQDDIMNISDGYSNGSVFHCTWRKSNVAFKDGKVNLTIDKDKDGGSIPYSGAEYRTKDHFGFGMYETKMKPIKNDGVVSSFFTYTGPSENTVWDEIDIEFLGKDTTKVQFNYYTDGVGKHEYLYDLGYDASESFHTYGFMWQKDYITWYVDSKPVYTAKSNIPQTPGQIMMNTWPGIGVNDWLKAYDGNTPLTAQYDYLSYKETAGGNTDTPSQGGDKPSQDESKDAVVTVKNDSNSANTMNQLFQIKSLKDIDLSKLTLRYYYEKNDSKLMNFYCDNAQISLNRDPWYMSFTSKVNGKFGADENGNYVDIKLNDNFTLKPEDGVITLSTRLANNDWSAVSNFKGGNVKVLYNK